MPFTHTWWEFHKESYLLSKQALDLEEGILKKNICKEDHHLFSYVISMF